MHWVPHVLDILPDEDLGAEAVRALRGAGLEAELVTEATSMGMPSLAQDGAKIVVRAEDAEDAWVLYQVWREKVGLDESLPGAPWTCTGCGERHAGNVDACWQCGASVDPAILEAARAAEEAEDPEVAAVVEELERAAVLDAIENVDARAAFDEEAASSAFSLPRMAFRFVVIGGLVWGLKELFVWLANR